MENINGIIYGYQCLNGKWYVGQTREDQIELRHARHERAVSGCKAFNAAMIKYGRDSFSKVILEDEIPTQDTLDYLECYWIRELDSYGANGYNMSTGGGGSSGAFRSKETKDKISENNSRYWAGRVKSEEHKQKIAQTLTGTKFTEERRRKHSEALCRAYSIGTKVSAQSKKVRCLETGETFSSGTAAALSIGGSGSGLSSAFSREGDPCLYKGVRWTRNNE